MHARHRNTLNALRAHPAPRTLPFRDIESLLKGLGCAVVEAEGARVVFVFNEHAWATHRLHPGKEARGYHIKGVRLFLEATGATR
jgi:uncharacterized membrane protein